MKTQGLDDHVITEGKELINKGAITNMHGHYLLAEDIRQYLYNLKNLNIFHVILFVLYDLMRFLG